MAPHQTPQEPIAIVGSGCRFPGESSSPSKLWELLKAPRDVQTEIPPTRFNPHAFYHPDNLHHGTSNVRHSYLLTEDHRHFDAQFFGIKPAEAHCIDPQQRLLMETVYESLESAGLRLEDLRGSETAVYVGLMCGDYADIVVRDPESFPMYLSTGTARSIMSNRVSYFFDWHGPSMTIDTACSSSLVAVHEAVQTLRAGRSRVAVAAGSNLCLGPEPYIAESKLQMLSPTGRSRMWDSQADGYARGDGVAAVVLKTLSAALADGDHIECLVRETGVNQDGRTRGITMPSSEAQTRLIQDTYARAGLDPLKPEERCQYFEAHEGTGTPTGDPLEAAAIREAFFPGDNNQDRGSLFVGSIKTVVGHTEGTAGLAGVLKASLALRNGTIPPNLLFNQLNPKIQPFYTNLEIATAAKPWPVLPAGVPRRASINSFGFGGTNAHAIIEAYEPAITAPSKSNETDIAFTPFVFSAASENALRRMLESYAQYLSKTPTIKARDLGWTLQARRSRFPFSTVISGATTDRLRSNLQTRLNGTDAKQQLTIVQQGSRPENPCILGVFTGQGAQWATMGRALYQSPQVRQIIQELDASLQALPVGDRPGWTLASELTADASVSRIKTAEISQPMCTAVQVVLVQLLQSAGVVFDAVVGHSSGEIAAAYTAGFLSATDAIRIAYYRGLCAQLAQGPRGQKGAMMAVGTGMEDAQELCAEPEFRGRMSVAAVNSSASVTLSGDADAIEQAKEILDEEKKFARVLVVDKAYHSHHMQACSERYLSCLDKARVVVSAPTDTKCVWYSSVREGPVTEADLADLTGPYWNDNMVNPVLFAQAVESALTARGPFNMAVEVGPHPALRGPAQQTIQDLLDTSLPYTPTLQRGMNDVEAMAECLGLLWQGLAPGSVDLSSYDAFLSQGAVSRVIKDLPGYGWDHDRVFWYESRVSRATRQRTAASHPILGTRCPDGVEQEFRWRNFLSLKELPWLTGHRIQGQIIFPGAGYISAAVDAARAMSRNESIQLVELQELLIRQAIVFEDENASVETLVSITDVTHHSKDMVRAQFSFYSAVGKESTQMTLNASGRLVITYGPARKDALPMQRPSLVDMVDVPSERFYNSLDPLGYSYTGRFRALKSMQRKLGIATGLVTRQEAADLATVTLDPAMLDAAIQAVLLAKSFPGDGELWCSQVPKVIHRIAVNLTLCAPSGNGEESTFPLDAVLTMMKASDTQGDVDVYSADGQYTMTRMEGIHAVPLEAANADRDRPFFSGVVWGPAAPDSQTVNFDATATPEEYELAYVLERVSAFYLRKIHLAFPMDHSARHEGSYVGLLNYATHVTQQVASGHHRYTQPHWARDTAALIKSESQRFPNNVDLAVMHIIGEHMVEVISTRATILEYLTKDNLLSRYYEQAMGIGHFSDYLASVVEQIVHRYPHMKVLEIGAGTGMATKKVIQRVGHSFGSYTFTDISSGFFENAREIFASHQDQMVYKVLDAEKDPVAQGFGEQSYDLIIASFVLHATSHLETTLRNLRRLLKPGGYVVMLEVTNLEQSRLGYIFGSLPGWWLGANDGRVLSPCVPTEEWDRLLKLTGFSGVDTVTSDADALPYPASAIVSQAVDETVDFLRNPLATSSDLVNRATPVVLIGGTSSSVRVLRDLVKQHLDTRFDQVHAVDRFSDLVAISPALSNGPLTLNLSDLDEPVFQNITADSLAALKLLYERSNYVLWVTEDARAGNPHQNQSLGFGRSMMVEMPHVQSQFLDLDRITETSSVASRIVDAALRFVGVNMPDRGGEVASAGLLWSTEPEIAVVRGQELLPRIKLNRSQNLRYNASRRAIAEDVDMDQKSVQLVRNGNTYALEQGSTSGFGKQTPGYTRIRVEVSSLRTLRLRRGNDLYLVAGTVLATGEKVIGFADKNSSIVDIPPSWMMHRPDTSPTALILSILCRLVSRAILSSIAPGGVLVVAEPDDLLAPVLEWQASQQKIRVVFATTREDAPQRPNWVVLHSQVHVRSLPKLAPTEPVTILDLSTGEEPSALALKLRASLHPASAFERLTSWFSDHAQHGEVHIPAEAMLTMSRPPMSPPASDRVIASHSFPVTDVSQISAARFPLTAVDWQSTSHIPALIRPVDHYPMLKANRTYWLVGLTGSLGLSLCAWMIQQGARNVVLTSRNPKIDPIILQELRSSGARVEIYAGDVTNRESLRGVYDRICQTLPPVAGVAQGAMVLIDTMIKDMEIDAMQRVLQPKVVGSINLDELFSAERPLDFFIFFSSATCVTGNIGQSNYAAANMFMTGLAANRKRRGLAGSVMNIGAIMGVGYVTRETSEALQRNLLKSGHVWMSEQDFHTIFAEAILAGTPGSDVNVEITCGLRITNASEEQRPLWSFNPRFQHLVVMEDRVEETDGQDKKGMSLKLQLREARTADEIYEAVKECFIAKLQIMLGLDDAATNSITSKAADELGIDSLNTVDIRSWFLKEMKVDIPVLRILGGATIGELIKFALEKLPSEMTPSLGLAPTAGAASKAASQPKPKPKQNTSKSVSPARSADASSSQTSEATSPSVHMEEVPKPLKSLAPLPKADVVSTTALSVRKEPLSFGQSRFWFLKLYLEDQTTFNITCLMRMTGPLSVDSLSRAVTAVGQRHEALRTCFTVEDGQSPVQTILPESTLRLERQEYRIMADVNAATKKLTQHVYDLESGKLMRVILLSSASDSSVHYVLIGYHHINMDGVSLEVFLADLEKAYRGQALSSDLLQYPDYAAKQRQERNQGAWQEDLTFWKNEITDSNLEFPLLPLASVAIRKPLTRYSHHRVEQRLDAGLGAQVRQLCQSIKTTPSHFYLATFTALLARLAQTREVWVGMADANRIQAETADSIGNYLNLLALRMQYDPEQPFAASVQAARKTFYGALAHSRVPFDVVLSELQVPRSSTHSPLFQVFMDYRQDVREKRMFGDCQFEGVEYEMGRTAYDIALDVVDTADDGPLIIMGLQESLYSPDAAQTLLNSFLAMVRAFAQDSKQPGGHVSLFGASDIEKALALGNGSLVPSQWPATLSHRIDEMAKQYPEKLALNDGDKLRLTFQEMSQRADSIASALLSANVSRQQRVAVFQHPSSDWICSMLAILRVGATYVPLDLRLELARLRSIVQDCEPTVLLVDSHTQSQVSDFMRTRPALTINIGDLPRVAPFPVMNRAAAEDEAVILYTSGSTGNPKGIPLTHENLRVNIEGNQAEFQFGPNDSLLQQIAFSFDFSVWQIFMALANGASLFIAPATHRGDPVALMDLVVREGITITGATPSEYRSWFQHGDLARLKTSQWTTAVSAGEAMTTNMIRDFQELNKSDLRLVNGYGPTEASMSSNKLVVPYLTNKDHPEEWMEKGAVVAGYTAPNYSIYIVDEAMNLLSVGLPGQILIGGPGIASGYLNNKELSRTRFIDDKYASPEQRASGWRWAHLTGDRGRLGADGRLRVEGRIEGDTQVKLRGYRIDLQDVEAAISNASPGVFKDLVVSLHQATQALVAHVVFSQDYPDHKRSQALEIKSLELPRYMWPARVVSIDQMPVTVHGKLDRKVLQTMDLPPIEPIKQTSTAHLTETQAQLVKLWEEVISKDILAAHHIVAESDFFAVGGTSMLLVELQRHIKSQFKKEIALPELFSANTVQKMALLIQPPEEAATTPAAAVDVAPPSSPTPSTPTTIDWNEEIQLPCTLREQISSGTPVPVPVKSSGLRIVLTGATGFIGRALLQQLTANPAISTIHCIAVRNPSAIPAHDKILVHAGDLTHASLGLAPGEAQAIFREADAVIHNGADVSFMKSYHSLRRTNVESTIALIQNSLSRHIPFHYISSSGIANLAGTTTFAEVSTASFTPPPDATQGYLATKWASERLLEEAHRRFALPVYIHRPSSVTGSNAPPLDLMDNLMAYARRLNAVPMPERSSWKGYLDFVPVEQVVRDVAGDVLSAAGTIPSARATKVHYIHHLGRQVSLAGVQTYLERETGAVYRALKMGEWLDEATQVGMDPLLRTYLESMDKEDVKVVFPRLVARKRPAPVTAGVTKGVKPGESWLEKGKTLLFSW
ncbi:putative hybrid NRPS/PKS enzyme [Aspergillus heteromorphus CBS 117.55]|uniref:Putative hybrid NRPS/PKS enzyme n=1 Tax=Aspergillus heteromorphus CBS 117.55 TaxID=1448321 RepID=A0A317UYY0_9EURO|nr:putative hybrid NRPS/PKS enzyme [Aspergillus heteromorphus CBS 117.55]PWY66108.1 putative hybrid NRPS/PKS enzyme [Aspergillus heteromorphus CBS 117.55]